MKWFYVENGQQAGPVEESQLQELIQSGKLRGDTLVWHEGMGAWQPFSAVCPPDFAAAVGATPISTSAPTGDTTEAVCAECGNIFRKEDMIRNKGAYVCANCKPVFLQRVREGLSGTATGAPGSVSEAQVRARDYEHDIGGYWNKAWEVFKSDPGLIIGVFLVVGLCIVAANIVPYLSAITSIIFGGPLLGGLFAFYLKKLRNQATAFGDGFSGFGPYFGQLLLGNFIPNVLAGLVMMPFVIVAVVVFLTIMPAMQGGGELSGAQVGMMIGAGLVVFVGICGVIYFQYCWVFTLWLVVDKRMGFWPAMSLSRAVVRKHWWQTFLLGIVAGLLGLVGFLLCGVGLLLTGPLALGMFACAYERLFGDMQPA